MGTLSFHFLFVSQGEGGVVRLPQWLAKVQSEWDGGKWEGVGGGGPPPASAWYTNKDWNAVVPINVYNVRQGYINSASPANVIYERGITSVVEINMRNLPRWLDGVYDNNLLQGTTAVSSNIAKPDGYSV